MFNFLFLLLIGALQTFFRGCVFCEIKDFLIQFVECQARFRLFNSCLIKKMFLIKSLLSFSLSKVETSFTPTNVKLRLRFDIHLTFT